MGLWITRDITSIGTSNEWIDVLEGIVVVDVTGGVCSQTSSQNERQNEGKHNKGL